MSNRLDEIFDPRPREVAPFGVSRPMGPDLIYLKSIRDASSAQMNLARLLERAYWPREAGDMPEDFFAIGHIPGPIFMQQALALTLDEHLAYSFRSVITELEAEQARGVER